MPDLSLTSHSGLSSLAATEAALLPEPGKGGYHQEGRNYPKVNINLLVLYQLLPSNNFEPEKHLTPSVGGFFHNPIHKALERVEVAVNGLSYLFPLLSNEGIGLASSHIFQLGFQLGHLL